MAISAVLLSTDNSRQPLGAACHAPDPKKLQLSNSPRVGAAGTACTHGCGHRKGGRFHVLATEIHDARARADHVTCRAHGVRKISCRRHDPGAVALGGGASPGSIGFASRPLVAHVRAPVAGATVSRSNSPTARWARSMAASV